MRAWAVALAVGLLSAPAAAQELRASRESERSWIVEVNGGRYRPAVDSEAGLAAQPYREIFGTKAMWLFEGEVDYELWSGFGTVALGLAGGYGVVYGTGLTPDGAERTPDLTTLKTLPLRALGVYRFDWLARELGIPLIPFGKLGLAHTVWWITEGGGDFARFGADRALGGKWGYQLAGGLALELNVLDPELGEEFDRESGVNAVLLQAQWMRLTADDFGGAGFDLSDTTWMFGLAFEF